MKKTLITLISLITICFLFVACGGSSEEKITLDEFNSIKTGMSYSQVCNIIGSEGELASSVDMNIGSEYKTEIYQWDGKGLFGANANVTFQGGKVVSKAQAGLK